jgi:excisionase family DNA binding protein
MRNEDNPSQHQPQARGHHALEALPLTIGQSEREAAVKAAVEAERKRIADAKPKMLLTVRQQVEQAGISGSQVRSLIASGRLAHVMVGSRVMIPAGAFEEFVESEKVKRQWHDVTKAQSSAGSLSVAATTSHGQTKAGAASAARARQIAHALKQPSPNGSTPEGAETARVIPLKSS